MGGVGGEGGGGGGGAAFRKSKFEKPKIKTKTETKGEAARGCANYFHDAQFRGARIIFMIFAF